MNSKKQKEETEALEVLVSKFKAPLDVIKELRVDFIEFLHYMETLFNPWKLKITLDSAINLYNTGYDERDFY